MSGRRVYSRDNSLIQVQSTCILASSPVCSLMNDPQVNIFIYLSATPFSSLKRVRNMKRCAMPYFSWNRLKSIFTSIHLMYLLFFPKMYFFVRSGIRSVFFLLPLLSCTWMFAEYSVITRNLLTQLLFAVSNTLLVSH